LQDAEQRNLHIGGDVANFVEENRPAVGKLKTAKTPLSSSCECTFLMTEEFRRDQRLRNRRAIDPNERLVGAP